MRTLKHSKIDKDFEFNETTNYYLCIENPKFYREFITELSSDEDEETSFYLIENGKQIKLGKNLFFIRDPLDRAVYDKKLNTSIQKDLASSLDAQENENYLLLVNKINDYLESISYDYPVKLTFDSEMGISSFLKAFSVAYEKKNDGILERMIGNIKVLSRIFNFKVIVVLNLADYLEQEEFNLFLQECHKLEVSILVLSSHLPSYSFDNSFIVQIDSDLCELHLDSKVKND